MFLFYFLEHFVDSWSERAGSRVLWVVLPFEALKSMFPVLPVWILSPMYTNCHTIGPSMPCNAQATILVFSQVRPKIWCKTDHFMVKPVLLGIFSSTIVQKKYDKMAEEEDESHTKSRGSTRYSSFAQAELVLSKWKWCDGKMMVQNIVIWKTMYKFTWRVEELWMGVQNTSHVNCKWNAQEPSKAEVTSGVQ